MKIQSVGKGERQNFLCRVDPNYYGVDFSHDMTSMIDENENFIDVLPSVTVRYTIEDAVKLVDAFKAAFSDWENDPYYTPGAGLYPVHQVASTLIKNKPELQKWTKTITLYRYSLAGEWIYGITNKMVDGEPTRCVEASIGGWEKWLSDRKKIIANAWAAKYHPMFI